MKKSSVTMAMVALAIMSCSRENELPTVITTPQPPLTMTPALRDRVMARGNSIVAETFSLLSSNLQSALASSGVTNALPYCSLAASPLTSSVADRHGVSVRRVTRKPRHPGNQANSLELGVLAQFEAALSAGNAPLPVVTNAGPGQITFFAPIVLTNALCLKCHGRPGIDISPGDLEVIKRLYPDDKAVGFNVGDLRGAWRIEFPEAILNPERGAPDPGRSKPGGE